jgi:uncharacterized protein
MPELFKTPGVYVKEIAKLPPSIAPVETAIPAFIGYTEKAEEMVAGDLLLKPKRITSMLEYRTFFGNPQKETGITVQITTLPDGSLKRVASLDDKKRSRFIMNYALEMFFANGGGPCYIVSVASYTQPTPTPEPADPPVVPAIPVVPEPAPAEPSEVLLSSGIKAIIKEDEPTLIVIPEAQRLSISKFKGIQNEALELCNRLGDRFVIMDVHGDDVSMSTPGVKTIVDAVSNFREKGVGTEFLKYGAAYGPNLDTVLPFEIEESKISVTIDGNAPPETLRNLKKTKNFIYEAAKAAISDLPMKLPPSSAMAGIYAATDSNLGVWRAPANFSVNNVVQPSIQITDEEHGGLNVDVVAGKSVNAIRNFQGKGPMIWGARTLAGNDNEWRYVNVRRFFIFVEESTKKAAMQFTFASNDANTWVKLQGMIENFLTTLWRQGALQGVKPEHAFYVAVGLNKTMTSLDILEGRLIVEIGMAAVRPAEFIVLRFSHMLAQS